MTTPTPAEARTRLEAVANGAAVETVYGREWCLEPADQVRADLSTLLAHCARMEEERDDLTVALANTDRTGAEVLARAQAAEARAARMKEALKPFAEALAEARDRYPEAGSAYVFQEACSHLELSNFEAAAALTQEKTHEN